mgnify:CR=1 FL=1
MTQHSPPQPVSLFDLVARPWQLDAGVRDVCFNVVGSSVVVTLTDGSLVFLQVKDAEDPETRMRTELETGRMTIRPRAKPLPVPVRTEGPLADADIAPCRVASQGFAFVHRDGGEVWRATAKGQTLRVARAGAAPVTALAALPDKRGLLVARGAHLAVVSPEDGSTLHETDLAHDILRVAVAPDAGRIACWGPGRVTILDADRLAPVAEIAAEGELCALGWSPDGRWLIGGCRDNAVLIMEAETAQADRIGDFPAPVASIGFSDSAGVMIASGAFRIVGWQLPDRPFGEGDWVPVETAKPGFTLIETVAVHPTRHLCAVGYANGLVMLCQIGKREEMLLREGRGEPVTALEWSPDGDHLAIGTADGMAAIATFPKAMFK